MDQPSHTEKLSLHNSASRSPTLSRSHQLSQVHTQPANSLSGRNSPAHPQWETLSSASNPPKPLPKKPRPKRSSEKAPGQVLLPTSRVEAIVNADPDNGSPSKEAIFCMTYATEQFIKSLIHHAHTRATLEGRVLTQYKDLADTAHYFDEFQFLKDMIPRPVKLGEALAARVSKLANQEAANDADMEVDQTSTFSGFVNEMVTNASASTSTNPKPKKWRKKRGTDDLPLERIVTYVTPDNSERQVKKRRRVPYNQDVNLDAFEMPKLSFMTDLPSTNPSTNTSTPDGVHIIRIRPRQLPAGQAFKQLLAEKAKNNSSNGNGHTEQAVKTEDIDLDHDVETNLEEDASSEPNAVRDDSNGTPAGNSDQNQRVEHHLLANGGDITETRARRLKPLPVVSRERRAPTYKLANGKARAVGNGVVFAPVGASDAPLWTRLPLPPPPSANSTAGAKGSASGVETHASPEDVHQERMTSPPHSPRSSTNNTTGPRRQHSNSASSSTHHIPHSPPTSHTAPLPPAPHPHSPHAQIYAAADDRLSFRSALSPGANPGRTIYSQQR